MLATPAISSTPGHAARLHARPPAGLEPQIAGEAVRLRQEVDRDRVSRVSAIMSGEGSGAARPEAGLRGSAATGARGESTLPSVPAHAPTGAPSAAPPGSSPPGSAALDARQIAEVAALEARDRAVRAHEQAHARAGGRYAGSPSFEYVTGPDGRRYAVAGHVRIDISTRPADPEATIAKMQVIKAAALAPADPSPADRQVAALADRKRRAAEADLRAEQAADPAAAETVRLRRLSALFAQTMVLPAPAPSLSRQA